MWWVETIISVGLLVCTGLSLLSYRSLQQSRRHLERVKSYCYARGVYDGRVRGVMFLSQEETDAFIQERLDAQHLPRIPFEERPAFQNRKE